MKSFLLFLFILILTGCSDKSQKDLDLSLSLAGDHVTEFQKVLDHYKNDSLKLEAAKFLIINMPGSFSRNNKIIEICQPFYNEYDSLAKLYDYKITPERGEIIDSLWNDFSNRHPKLDQLSFQVDIETITAKQLISEIDLAFKAWQENIYTKDCSFEDFCEYILPYRRMNGLVVDNSRKVFYERHHGEYFTQPGENMINEADSLLFRYKNLTHSRYWGMGIPILNASTFDYMRHGLCEHRCWYNSLLFSSLGMAVAIDFVPAWGNRRNSHTWNVLIKNGQSYAFEAFWDDDRWKYKRIYNNKTFDPIWGRFRLPKVYRYTYKNYFEGPMTDKRVDRNDIPPLFKNIKKRDVSHEYFDTVNVSITLENIPGKTYYAYLCVLNGNEWQPVQWGKIVKKNVTFNGMGKDIIYLPCYFKNGTVSFAGEPFLLTQEGKMETFKHNLSDTESLYIKHYSGTPLHTGNYQNNISISRIKILGETSSSFKHADTLCIFPDTIDIFSKKISSMLQQPVRYLRLILPLQKLAFSDLSFFYKKIDGKEIKIPNIKLLHPLDSTENGERTEYIFDNYFATGYKKEMKQDYVDIDLCKEYCISSIRFAPYFEPSLKKKAHFELFYWDNGWKVLGSRTGSEKHVIFYNVPKGALFILKHKNEDINSKTKSRSFIYKNNEILWH
ncbi:MAG: hypothetical protein WCQ96_05715 [Patescibacteria group bacterium]